jgi:predicted RNase H-related nuclease YkuK (DUF458 family)
MWHTPSGRELQEKELLEEIKKAVSEHAKVYVGCDSAVVGDHVFFADVVCLHGGDGWQGGRYFFKREGIERKVVPTLKVRITEEANRTVMTASMLMEHIDPDCMEIHLDVNRSKIHASSVLAERLSAYARSLGVDVKLKPDSWASTTIADKHSRRFYLD